MSNKELKIDFSSERLLNVASSLIEEGKLIDALKQLNMHDERFGPNHISLNHRANIYDDLYLYDKSIAAHFAFFTRLERYGENAGMNLMTDTYSDLCAIFDNRGDELVAEYYYAKALLLQYGTQAETVVDEVAAKEMRPTKKPQFADISDEMGRVQDARLYLLNGKVDAAIETLEDTKPTDKSYLEQRTILAEAYLLKDRYDEVIEILDEVLRRQSSYIEAGSILVQAYLGKGRQQDAEKEVERLIALNPESEVDIQRVAYVASDTGMDSQAYDMYKRLNKDGAYTLPTMYYYAVSAYNSGRYTKCIDIMDALCTIYNNSEIAKYLSKEIRAKIKARNEGETLEKLPYNYSVPDEEYFQYAACVEAYIEGETEGLEKTKEECYYFIREVEGNEENAPLTSRLIEMLDKYRMDNFIEEMLCDINLAYSAQTDLLSRLILRDEDIDIGMSRVKVYYYEKMTKLAIGSRCRRTFVKQYANAIAKFGFVYHDSIGLFRRAIEDVYKCLERNNRIGDSKKKSYLFCSIVYQAYQRNETFRPILAFVENNHNIKHSELLEYLGLPYTAEEDKLAKWIEKTYAKILRIAEAFSVDMEEVRDEL